MRPVKFKDQTFELGAPQNWDSEKHGECMTLPVRVTYDGGLALYESRWRPSFLERVKLLFGRPVRLWVNSNGHPPVSMGV